VKLTNSHMSSIADYGQSGPLESESERTLEGSDRPEIALHSPESQCVWSSSGMPVRRERSSLAARARPRYVYDFT